ncbi:MAG: rane protein insertase YidC [Actinomycetota bacterium]
MPDLLWPIKWVIELILVAFHSGFTFLGLQTDSGLSWVLAIVGLVLVVRAALIPIFVKQIKSQRNMMLIQPELQKLQKKYRGKTDRESRERFAREQMDLYKRTGSNPLSSCLPLLLQMPIFMGLFFVLNDAQANKAGVGLLDQGLASSFSSAELFGAPLAARFVDTFSEQSPNFDSWTVRILAAVMIFLMTASQFITQKQIIAKNQNPDIANSQFMQTQKILLYVLPLVFLISGVSFPLGVMTYWTVSNFWTMGQQYLVIRNMPTPGSPAFKEREDRLRRKGKLVEPEAKATPSDSEESEGSSNPPAQTSKQRQQPVRKQRAKKKRR